jgi:exonuclease VII small subunit
MDEEMRKRFDALDRQLHAIVTRLEEQDASLDRLMGKVDRLGVLARAGEEAMTSLDALSKRVAKLEAARRGDN